MFGNAQNHLNDPGSSSGGDGGPVEELALVKEVGLWLGLAAQTTTVEAGSPAVGV